VRTTIVVLALGVSAGCSAPRDPPPPYAGYTWTREGRAVSPEELAVISGPEHCDWQSATLLYIRWPPPTGASSPTQARQYVRDPRGVTSPELRDRLQLRATLPADARPTGYVSSDFEIFVSPTDQDEAIYVVSPRSVERWPRNDVVGACL
jgi:hypothetical protein